VLFVSRDSNMLTQRNLRLQFCSIQRWRFEMRSYEAARKLFGFLGVCAKGIIILGCIVAYLGGTAAASSFRAGPSELQALLGAAPGAVLALAGFFGLAMVQMGRASVDSAEYAQQSLAVSRQQLEVSREVLDQGKVAAASYAAILQKRPTAEATNAVSETDIAPSYGNQPGTKSDQLAALPAATAAIETTEAPDPSPIQIEHTPDVPLDVALPDKTPEPIDLTPEQITDKITRIGDTYQVSKSTFSTLARAEQYAAQLGVNSKAKLSDV
jgi:hypothetical protein